MRIYKNKQSGELEKVICNKCKREIIAENGIIKEGVMNIKCDWDYFSNKDGQSHSFDLCEKCYDEIIKDFALKPAINDINEFV